MSDVDFDGGCCGPVGSRIEAAKTTERMLANGHIAVAEIYESIAQNMQAEDAAEGLALAKWHREIAEQTVSKTLSLEEVNAEPT